MLQNITLTNLPPYAKLFVGLFTALMLCVCVWAALIYYIEKGIPDENNLPAYLTESTNDIERQEEAGLDASDSEAVLAPVWDSELAGREVHVDSLTNLAEFRHHDAETENEVKKEERSFRDNVGLAHTHINGQTLLFFAVGFIFLFTSVLPRTKKICLWLFGSAVVIHVISLTGEE